jgi:NADH-quinone oxidoreductase subunit J
MMLDINVERVTGGYAKYLPLGIVVAGLMVIELAMIIWRYSGEVVSASGFAVMPEGYSNTEALGAVLYTEHVYAFEIAAVILLLAIIAAITLTMRHRQGLKHQNIARQVSVRARDRIRIVKMDAERPEGEGQS